MSIQAVVGTPGIFDLAQIDIRYGRKAALVKAMIPMETVGRTRSKLSLSQTDMAALSVEVRSVASKPSLNAGLVLRYCVQMWRSPLLISLALTSAFASIAMASHGPGKGYIFITGGFADYKRFIALAGGTTARIVVISAASNGPTLPAYCDSPGPFVGFQCTVVNTTEPAVADSEKFVAPIKRATAVWLEADSAQALGDTYLHTRVPPELSNLLDRGGVVGGSSYGASVLGSLVLQDSSGATDGSPMTVPGHETGFELLDGVVLGQDVDVRNRENELTIATNIHPELLGLGLGHDASITVHGDILLVNGTGRLAVWDGRPHYRGYYYLRSGDTLELTKRSRSVGEHAPEPVHIEVTLPGETLRRYSGIYETSLGVHMTITVEDGQMVSQVTGERRVCLFPEGDSMFFAKTDQRQVQITEGPNGNVVGLTLLRSGPDVFFNRLDESQVKLLTARR